MNILDNFKNTIMAITPVAVSYNTPLQIHIVIECSVGIHMSLLFFRLGFNGTWTQLWSFSAISLFVLKAIYM